MWTRRAMLAGTAGLLALPRWASASTSKRLVLVLASGGWDVTYALDPKLGLPSVEGPEVDEDPSDPLDREAIRTFSGIPIVTNARRRPAVSAFFEAYGRRTTVVNGVYTASLSHEAALVRALTGTSDVSAPDLAAIAGQGGDHPLASVDLSGQAFFGPYASRCGRLGHGGQLKLLLERRGFVAPEGAEFQYPTWTPNDADRAAMAAYLARRTGTSAVDLALRESRIRAARIREELPSAVQDLVVGEGARLISDGKTAVDLLQAGICRSVSIDSRAHWDTHADNAQQHVAWQSLFTGLTRLVDGLVDRGMLEDTVVVVLSEMTRTPVRNREAGKDHWPTTSALVVGGGLDGGRVLGGTTDRLDATPVDLRTGQRDSRGEILRYDHLVAGLLEVLDVDPAAHLPGVVPLGNL